jgi:hypothetical protein
VTHQIYHIHIKHTVQLMIWGVRGLLNMDCIAKEMLGYIRNKYSSVPIPNGEVTLKRFGFSITRSN